MSGAVDIRAALDRLTNELDALGPNERARLITELCAIYGVGPPPPVPPRKPRFWARAVSKGGA